MRYALFAMILLTVAPAAQAQDDSCAQTEAWFNQAVESRQTGQSERAVRRSLRADMGQEAADQLVAFVFALPAEQLSPAVGAMARAQCEGL